MPVFWLDNKAIDFPPVELATREGLLAVGGDLSTERLLHAYASGIFPWYNEDDPILWWSPDPRFVLFPAELKVAKSMRPYFNQSKFQVTYDQSFETVIRNCSQQDRKGQGGGTWINQDIMEAYTRLNREGYAHSVEVWQGSELVAGLYGIALGKIFFGESMFTHVSNGSKFGFITLVQKLIKQGFRLIDCQQETGHLASLGAKAITRKAFIKILEANKKESTFVGNWENFLNSAPDQ